MRRSVLKNIVCIILILSFLAFPLASCRSETKFSKTYLEYFDTVTTFVSYSLDTKEADLATEILDSELQRYHRLFDIYNTYDGMNNIKSINDNAGKTQVPVDAELIEFLEFCIDMHSLTSGYTNIAMGSVLSLWHNEREMAETDPDMAKLPSNDALLEASKHCDISMLKIDRDSCTVYLADALMSLDVGAIAKGYTAQKISDRLRSVGIDDFILNMGGNVIASGKKANDTDWSAGIQNPDDLTTYIASLSLSDASLVTSGSYMRYYTVDGKDYHHIIDPITHFPKNLYKSVSVIAQDSGVADALSTALFNMSVEEGLSLVNSDASVEAMWILENGQTVYSNGFKKFILGEETR